MIIALHGKKGSGKDTVAKIIQELYPDKFKIVKFADIIKDLVCKITGCSKDQLEDTNFKESSLPKQFYKYAVYIKEESPYEDVLLGSYSDIEEANQVLYQDLANRYVKTIEPTYRDLMIDLGTAVREIDENIWVYALLNSLDYYGDYIITDLRFKNELNILKKYDPETIFIKIERLRIGDKVIFDIEDSPNTTGVVMEIESQNDVCILGPDHQVYWRNALEFCIPSIGHQSEIDLDDYDDWDYTIFNYTSKEVLKRRVTDFCSVFNLNEKIK